MLAAQPFVGCDSGSADGAGGKDSAANANAPDGGKSAIAKVIAVEETFVTLGLRDAWAALPPDLQDIGSKGFGKFDIKSRLENFAELRLKEMDAAGIDVQVLSPATPGVQNLNASLAVNVARQTNNFIAEVMQKASGRFEAFATLPTPNFGEAPKELERAVKDLGFSGAVLYGRTGSIFPDHPDYLPIFETAARLQVPVFIHPQMPPAAVRDLYYSGFGGDISDSFATSGWGWHLETGIQAVRLILSGLFDRFPNLQIILGHWGQSMIFYLERIDGLSRFTKERLKKPVADYVRQNFYISPSGILNQQYLKWTLEVMGPERVLFATDYLYKLLPDNGARDFFQQSGLDTKTQNLIAAGNWQRLTGNIKSI